MITIDAADVVEGIEASRPTGARDPVGVLYRASQLLVASALQSDHGCLAESVLKDRGILFDMTWFVAVEEIGDSLLGNREARARVAQMVDKERAMHSNNYGSELRRACERLANFYGEHAVELPTTLRRLLKLDSD